MSLENIAQRLEELGCPAKAHSNRVDFTIDGKDVSVRFDDDWCSAIKSFYKARQYRFDTDRKLLLSNRRAEYRVIRLDPRYVPPVEHIFSANDQEKAVLGTASKEFTLAYFCSDEYAERFDRIKERMHRRLRIRERYEPKGTDRKFRPSELFFTFNTITYEVPRKPNRRSVDDVGFERVKACLFALAQQRGECWELDQEIKSKGMTYPGNSDNVDAELEIPRAKYDDRIVTYYKVAKSSQFPSQVFLSYYHILEFHFLRVADEALYNAVCSHLNDPGFRPTYERVTGLVSAIQRNDTRSDEKSMLHGVLRKYVAEDEFIRFIEGLEAETGSKTYSTPNQWIFGEKFTIKLERGHALANAAAVLKHIRNALVHSSDRYTREDCFLPFSESEEIIVRFIPMLRYLAEQVIFSTADA